MKASELEAKIAQRLRAAGIASARLDAVMIIGHVLNQSREWLLAHDDALVSSEDGQRVEELALRRAKREPLAYIMGYKEFYGRRFMVTSDVLIPRPESEVMIDVLSDVIARGNAQTIDDAAKCNYGSCTYRLIDIGTGSGCLGITAKLEHPELDVTLSDISDKALEVARKNAEQLDADVGLVRSNLMDNVSGKFDIILANLPYVNPNWDYLSPELKYEPDLALYASDDDLALIYKLINQVPAHLVRGGYIILEMDTPQIERVAAYAEARGLSIIRKLPFTLVLEYSSLRSE